MPPSSWSTVIHLIAAFGTLAALGAICLGVDEKQRKLANIVHGVSLLALLLAGLHMITSNEGALMKTGSWWHVKILLWLALGVAPVIAKRKILSPSALILIVLGIASVAAFLANFKPF